VLEAVCLHKGNQVVRAVLLTEEAHKLESWLNHRCGFACRAQDRNPVSVFPARTAWLELSCDHHACRQEGASGSYHGPVEQKVSNRPTEKPPQHQAIKARLCGAINRIRDSEARHKRRNTEGTHHVACHVMSVSGSYVIVI
jgi:hypothetical protein